MCVVYNTIISFHSNQSSCYVGVATFTLQVAMSVLDEGTFHMCCVAISGLPADGLGCDIDIQLDITDVTTGTNHVYKIQF